MTNRTARPVTDTWRVLFAERDVLEARLAAVQEVIDHARKISPSERAVVYVADLERALGMTAPTPHKLGGNDGSTSE